MKRLVSWMTRIGMFALALLGGSCDGFTEPELGSLRITIRTVGGDPDLDGYHLIVDNGEPRAVGLFTTVTLRDLPAGEHRVELQGYADNCDLSQAPLRPVIVVANETVRVTFEVLCFPTGIAVRTSTTGPDLDPDGYTVELGPDARQRISSSGVVTLSRLTPGTYTVTLTGLAANCQLVGEPSRTVQVTFRQLASVGFDVTCTATTGVIEVTSSTTGVDQDPTGYAVRVDQAEPLNLLRNDVARFRSVAPGVHIVAIQGVAWNCTVVGGPSVSVLVAAGGQSRDTARVSFDVSCARANKIAFLRGMEVMVALLDGSEAVKVAMGWKAGPSWSPDGGQLVFQRAECYSGYYYYYYYCYDFGLGIVGGDGLGLKTLSSLSTDRDPAWGPDGQTIAFSRDGRLELISPNGTSGSTLTIPASRLTHPAWHPDGTRLAFTCEVESGNQDICIVSRDGSGFLRLTTGLAAESEPDWSPDGTRIALTTTQFGGNESVGLMAAQGSQVTFLVPGGAPRWSPDGTRLIFRRFGGGIASIRPDGTDRINISSSTDDAPAWRP